MIHQPQHQQLENRLSQNVKYNPALAQRLEESMGYICDVRENNESVGIEYIGDVNNNEAY